MSKMDNMNEFDFSEILEGTFEKIDFTMVVRVLFSFMAAFLAFDLIPESGNVVCLN